MGFFSALGQGPSFGSFWPPWSYLVLGFLASLELFSFGFFGLLFSFGFFGLNPKLNAKNDVKTQGFWLNRRVLGFGFFGLLVILSRRPKNLKLNEGNSRAQGSGFRELGSSLSSGLVLWLWACGPEYIFLRLLSPVLFMRRALGCSGPFLLQLSIQL